jgi:hypothetical protein
LAFGQKIFVRRGGYACKRFLVMLLYTGINVIYLQFM